MSNGQLHEGFSHHTEEKKASEKSLGQVFAGACAIIGLVRYFRGHEGVMLWFAAAVLFLLLAYFWQAPLKPINRFWHHLGLVMFAVINPVIMAIVFYVAVTPTGILMRAFGKDPLRMKLDPSATTYWITRDPAGPKGPDMQNQF